MTGEDKRGGAEVERKLSDSNAGMTLMKGEGEGRIVWKGRKGFQTTV